MTRSRLLDLLRRAAALSAGQRLILAGSQAFYASTASAPQIVERSEEADLLLVGVDRSLFLRFHALLSCELFDFPTLLARMEFLRAGVYANAIPDRLAKLAGHLREWKRDDLARSIPAKPRH